MTANPPMAAFRPTSHQFEVLQEFEILAVQAALRTKLGKLSEANDDLQRLESMSKQLGGLYFNSRCEALKASIVSRALEKYESDTSIRDAAPNDIEFWRYAAQTGTPKACWLLVRAARARFYPVLVPESEQLKWLVQAAAHGDADACCDLAEIYDEGRVYCQRNNKEADAFYSKGFRLHLARAARGDNDRYAMLQLGNLARRGVDGTPSGVSNGSLLNDYKQAIYWYRRVLEIDLGLGCAGDVPADRVPGDSCSSNAMIQLAEILELTGDETSKHKLLARYRWAARATSAYAHIKLADFLGRCYKHEFGQRRRQWLYRRAGRLGNELGILQFANLRRIQMAGKHPSRPGLLQYDRQFVQQLSQIQSCGKAIYVRALYKLLFSEERDHTRILEDFVTSISLGYRPPHYFHDKLITDGYLRSIIHARGRVKFGLLLNDWVTRLSVRCARLKLFLGKLKHYDDTFITILTKLQRLNLLADEFIIAWLQLVSGMADLLDDPDKRFWNQLAVDAQLASAEFSRLFWSSETSSVNKSRPLDSLVSKSTLALGLCYNARDSIGLPIKYQWRQRYRDEPKGWNEIPKITVTPEGFHIEPAAAFSISPPLLIEQDISVILALALLEGGTSGRSFWFSLDQFEDVETPKLPWKFVRKVFSPDWLAGTEFGKTLYYCDQIHLQDRHGRSTPSMAHGRISAEYSQVWMLERPWDTSQIYGASAWNSSSGRSAIHLDALAVPETPPDSSSQVVIDGNFQTFLKFDTSQKVWTDGQEDPRVGAGNRRYCCTREGEYATSQYGAFAEQFPVFERLAILQGLYSLICHRLKNLSLDSSSPLVKFLESQRNTFSALAARERADNPNLVVFDLR